ncbi:MAG: efflux transporter outer membrane subunit, partial [Geminicoccales bacterium]
MHRLTAFALAASLAGCAVGPDYVRPELPETEGFVRADAAAFSSAETEAEFWRRLDDPLLARLIDRALSANHDLRIGLARLDRARALLGISNLDRLPIVTARGTAADVRQSTSEAPGIDPE